LLKTIRLPKDLKELKIILPKPNYKHPKENTKKIPFMGKNNLKKEIKQS